MKTSPAITVVLATFNGGERLRETLNSMKRLRWPDTGWKLVVVDNASTDRTPDIIDAYKAELPMTSLLCTKRGKNAALNMAIPHFEGELIAFTDDDVVLPQDWLVALQALASDQPQFAVFGGRIVPRWPYTPKEEIINGVSCAEAFATHASDTPDGPIDSCKIWGPNMAVRAAVFREGFQFDESIGPTKGNYIPGSETSFNTMLEKHGFQFYFSNDIIVEHQIRPEQLTMKWLMKRAYRFGKGRAFWEHAEQKDNAVRKIGIFPRWYGSYWAKSHAEYLVSWLTANKTSRVHATWNMMIAYGLIVERVILHKSHRSAHIGSPSMADRTIPMQ